MKKAGASGRLKNGDGLINVNKKNWFCRGKICFKQYKYPDLLKGQLEN